MPAASVRGYVNKQSVPQKLIFPCLGGAWDLKHLSVKESGGNVPAGSFFLFYNMENITGGAVTQRWAGTVVSKTCRYKKKKKTQLYKKKRLGVYFSRRLKLYLFAAHQPLHQLTNQVG